MRRQGEQITSTANKRKRALLNSGCVACGAQNAKGLRLTFFQCLDGVGADWVPTEDWESFRGFIHGGIISTVLDEAMSKAIIARDWEAVTVELTVRFRRRVSPGEELQIRGWVVEKRKRKISAEARLITRAGDERAHAWATFLTLPGT